MRKPEYIVYDLPHFNALLKERNRLRRALKRIAKGYVMQHGVRIEYTPHFCRTVALKALNTKTRNRH